MPCAVAFDIDFGTYSTATFRKTNFGSWDEQLALFAHAVEMYQHVDIVLPLAATNPADEENWFTGPDESGLVAPPKPDLTPIDVGLHGLLYSAYYPDSF